MKDYFEFENTGIVPTGNFEGEKSMFYWPLIGKKLLLVILITFNATLIFSGDWTSHIRNPSSFTIEDFKKSYGPIALESKVAFVMHYFTEDFRAGDKDLIDKSISRLLSFGTPKKTNIYFVSYEELVPFKAVVMYFPDGIDGFVYAFVLDKAGFDLNRVQK